MRLEQLLLERLATGLLRASVDTCSKWAENYRVIKDQPFRFKHFPWLKAMHDCEAELVVGRKAAQMGFTEFALNRTFYKLDVQHTDCLYILPTSTDASEFSAGRFDPALEESPYIKNLFAAVNNVAVKRAGASTLYVRGSKSRSKLKSIPTGFIVMDEVEEMVQENIELAMERTSGQDVKQILMISTPVLDNAGIDRYYQISTQEQFFFPCPLCNRQITLEWPDSVVITAEHATDPRVKESHYICRECKGVLDHSTKADWLAEGKYVPAHPGLDIIGYGINQMYSTRVTPAQFSLSYLKGLSDPSAEQEFYNSKLGKPHIIAEHRVTLDMVDTCLRSYNLGEQPKSTIVTMGVDVGRDWHFEISEWFVTEAIANLEDVNSIARPRVLLTGAIPLRDGEEELAKLMNEYTVKGCVIDRHPETLAAMSIGKRFWGTVYLCIFGSSNMTRQLNITKRSDELMVQVDRTSWFDIALSRFRHRTIHLPTNTPHAYKKHMTVPARIYKKDADGNPVARWHSPETADHYALARVYNEIALPLALNSTQHQDIKC